MPRNAKTADPWPPGVSANPGGRPKTKALTGPLRSLLETPLDEEHPLWPFMQPPFMSEERAEQLRGRTPGEAVAMIAILQAMAGDKDARQFVADRAEGRLALPIQTDDEDRPALLAHLSDEELIGIIAANRGKRPDDEPPMKLINGKAERMN